MRDLKSYLKSTYEYEFHILRNTKDSAAMHDGKNHIKVRRSLVCHFLRNCLFSMLILHVEPQSMALMLVHTTRFSNPIISLALFQLIEMLISVINSLNLSKNQIV